MERNDNNIKNGLFHRLSAGIPEDKRLNNPFFYEPDELIIEAATELQRHLPRNPREGKMWGVLIVEFHGIVGFINAYSGQIDDSDLQAIDEEWRGVPPVFDYLQPDGYFKTHEAVITNINHQIADLESSPEYIETQREYKVLQQESENVVAEKQKAMNEAKERRHELRQKGGLTEEELASMVRESQFLKAEVHRAKVEMRHKLSAAASRLSEYKQKVESLKRRRSMLSDQLQSWLFRQFVLLNASGERKSMPEIFRNFYIVESSKFKVQSSMFNVQPSTFNVQPSTFNVQNLPSGSGECCEPKMLQYAYSHGMHPLRMASFWWGPALGGELRKQGNFYPACSGRCKPILSWMLQGLDVMPNPLNEEAHQDLKIIYEDEYLVVVNKPSGMLAAPGKGSRESVISILENKWGKGSHALSVHRLDMATSGLLIVAKDKKTQSLLRKEFENRQVEKEYLAIVEGSVSKPHGTISLPLSADITDRPRQKVDFENGKESITEYEVLSQKDGKTRLQLKPFTGRTHQLRVHCASPLGLNAPIKGDTLYGQPWIRLCLQAYRLTFIHPVSGRRMSFKLPPEF